MRIVLALLLLSCACPALAQPPEIISFTAVPAIGDTTNVQWNIRNADHAYVVNLGKIEGASGTTSFTIKEDTILTLIAENSSGTAVQNLTVKRTGKRGQAEFPPEEEFKAKRDYTASAPSVVKILDAVHYLLQDYLGFQVKENQDLHSKRITFLTTRLEQPKVELLPPDANGKQRRIAYLVTVEESPLSEKRFAFTLDASIEYHRRSESTWRKEEDAGLYSSAIAKLYTMLAKEL